MRTKWTLEAADAATIVTASLRAARAKGWKVSVAVVDDGGHLLHLVRDDGAGYQTASVATRKAQTSAMSRVPTAVTEALALDRLTMLAFADRLPLRGGLPVMRGTECVGAVGVSGVKSEQDEEIAQAGLDALVADTEEAATK